VDWWIADMAGGPAHPTGLIERLHQQNVNRPKGSYWPLPGAWLPDYTVLLSGSHGDSTNIWSIRIGSEGEGLGPAQRWTAGTLIEGHPSAAETLDHGTVMAYDALNLSTGIWRMRLTPDGLAAGPAERLVEGLAEIGSPSLSADGSKLVFATREIGGQVIRIMDLPSRKLRQVARVRSAQGLVRPIISGDGNVIAYWAGNDGYLIPARGGTAELVCSKCGPPTHVSYDGGEALFEGGSVEQLLLCRPGSSPRPAVAVSGSEPPMESGGRWSPNHRWITFSAARNNLKQILIAPVTPEGSVAPDALIPLSELAGYNDREPYWSADGRRIYFISNRDGIPCVWARAVDPRSAQPEGAAFPVAHFHQRRRGLRGPSAYSGEIGLSAAPGSLVFTLTEMTGNVWLRLVEGGGK
jgi:hypothetical protein